MVITKSILDLLFPVTQLLQGPAKDIADVTYLIEVFAANAILLIPVLISISGIIEFACKVGIQEYKPRASKLQRNRNSIPSESISDYFKKIVTIPLLDQLTVEIERRF